MVSLVHKQLFSSTVVNLPSTGPISCLTSRVPATARGEFRGYKQNHTNKITRRPNHYPCRGTVLQPAVLTRAPTSSTRTAHLEANDCVWELQMAGVPDMEQLGIQTAGAVG